MRRLFKIFQNKEVKNLAKKWLSFLALFLVLLSLNLTQVAADSPPSLPSSFWGTVKVDGENVNAGTTVTIKMGDVVLATTHVELFGEDSVYAINIPGEMSMEGITLDFFIGGDLADQSDTWQSGTNANLNLSIVNGEDFYIYIPLVVK